MWETVLKMAYVTIRMVWEVLWSLKFKRRTISHRQITWNKVWCYQKSWSIWPKRGNLCLSDNYFKNFRSMIWKKFNKTMNLFNSLLRTCHIHSWVYWMFLNGNIEPTIYCTTVGTSYLKILQVRHNNPWIKLKTIDNEDWKVETLFLT